MGKTAGNHPIPQDQINRILVEHARAGRTVVRLKGGDPFVLGRGGEEALHCLAHGVPVEVVPGVTSAVSVPAAAGIPVTHRGITTSLVIASAHAGARTGPRRRPHGAARCHARAADGPLGPGRDRRRSSSPRDGTRAPRTAVISDGWTPRQRTVTGTLAGIAARPQPRGLPGPAVIVVGDVVALRAELGDLSGVPQAEIARAG